METTQIIRCYLTKEKTTVRYIGETKKIAVQLMSTIGIKGTRINLGRKVEEVHEILLEKGFVGDLLFISGVAMVNFPDLKKKAHDLRNKSINKDYLYVRKSGYQFPLLSLLDLIVEIIE